MKSNLKSLLMRLPKNIILCAIIGLLSLSSFNMYTLKVESDSINKIVNVVNKNIDKDKENYISSILDLGYKLCLQTTDILSKQLETELLVNYDLKTLKKEFDQSILSEEFYEVMKKVLNVDSENNILFNTEKVTMVALKDGLIAEFSNNNVDHIATSGDNVLLWEEYINKSVNPSLTRDALETVFKNKNSIAFIQKSGKPEIKTSNINDLINLYIKEGKEALSDYYFLTASLITEDGDIFGTYDKTFLSENKNYKLIVLNTTSVKEVLNIFETQINSIHDRGDDLLTRIDGYTDLRRVVSIVGNVSMFITALCLVSVYNRKLTK